MSEKNFFGEQSGPVDEKQDRLWDELAMYPAELDPQLSELMTAPVVRRRRWWRAPLAVAASLVVAVCGWLVLSTQNPDSQLYQTGRGERIVVNLADGSVMHLNSGSRVEVRIDKDERWIAVQRGEALFDVARDEARKFIVSTPRGRVEALGTRFNINLYEEALIVTVAEGRVLVSNGLRAPSEQAAEVAVQGQQVVVSDAAISSRQLSSLVPVLAWTEGKIIFNGQTLRQALDQVNRHSAHRIAILDARISELLIYGVFNAGDHQGFVSALERSFNIAAMPESDELTYLAYLDRGK